MFSLFSSFNRTNEIHSKKNISIIFIIDIKYYKHECDLSIEKIKVELNIGVSCGKF